VNSDEQCARELKAEKSERTRHVWCGTGLSGATTGQGFQRSSRSKPQWTCWRGTHRTVNSGCPVHHQTVQCAYRRQKQLTARKYLEAINTPNHLLQWHPSILNITFIARAKETNPKTHPKHSIHSKPQNHLYCLETWERILCVHLCSCCLDCLSPSPFLVSKCFVKLARDT
jgi:hypothetical protein